MCAAAQLHPDALDSLQPGQVLAGAYQLTRPLGAGGARRVWEAEQLRLGGRVAIKFLDPSLLGDDIARARFEREARAVCEVRSPYIVQVQDHGIDGDVPFLVMELLEGEDLGQLLERERALELAETAEVIGQLCRALDKAHRAGFVHRDVKPENIFVIEESDGSRFIKLLDFGFVKQLGAQTLTVSHDAQIGSPHYLSPEQIARPAAVDARSDTWAVGVTAYRMLAGRLPFEASGDADAAALFEAILQGSYQPLTQLRPELPPELDEWFGQMLAVSPQDRFATLRAASTALGSISRARTFEVRGNTRFVPPPAAQPEPAAAPRRWLVPVVALLVGAGVGVWLWARPAVVADRNAASGAEPAPLRAAKPAAAVEATPPSAPVRPAAGERAAPVKPAAAERAPLPAASGQTQSDVSAATDLPPAQTSKTPRRARPKTPAPEQPRVIESPADPLPKDRGF